MGFPSALRAPPGFPCSASQGPAAAHVRTRLGSALSICSCTLQLLGRAAAALCSGRRPRTQ
eukprot:8115233-Alexandrium_andersonii.AAC.1